MSSEAGHSPSPWRVDMNTDGLEMVRDANGGWVCLGIINEDDAPVLAAAPELLRVAHLIADYCFTEVGSWRSGDPIGDVYKAAVAAIAKAEGKS